MTLPFTTLDVFTVQRFAGNPLAVVRVPKQLSSGAALSKAQKQLIALEFALSETIFLHDIDPATHECEASIFTPHAELPFAGHPVIGAGFYLLNTEAGNPDGRLDRVTFLLPAGRINMEKAATNDGAAAGVRASVPHDVHLHKKTLRDVIDDGGGGGGDYGSASGGDPVIEQAELDAPAYSIVKGMTFLLANVGPDADTLKKVQPGQPLDESIVDAVADAGPWAGGHVGRYYYALTQPATATTTAATHVQTRMVASRGVEDPATGSAACALSCFLAQQGRRAGRSRYEITQGVEMGRRSVITVEVVAKARAAAAGEGEGVDIVSVHLGGSAVEVMRGEVSL